MGAIARDRELVRAKMPSGGRNNVTRRYAEIHNLEILAISARLPGGRPKPAKPKKTLKPAGGSQGTSTSLPGATPTGSGSAEATS